MAARCNWLSASRSDLALLEAAAQAAQAATAQCSRAPLTAGVTRRLIDAKSPASCASLRTRHGGHIVEGSVLRTSPLDFGAGMWARRVPRAERFAVRYLRGFASWCAALLCRRMSRAEESNLSGFSPKHQECDVHRPHSRSRARLLPMSPFFRVAPLHGSPDRLGKQSRPFSLAPSQRWHRRAHREAGLPDWRHRHRKQGARRDRNRRRRAVAPTLHAPKVAPASRYRRAVGADILQRRAIAAKIARLLGTHGK